MRAGWTVVTALTIGLGGCNDDGSCGGSVEMYCSGMADCPQTWASAQDPATWGCYSETDEVQLSRCPSALVARVKYIDTGRVYYFDLVTGELYRVDRWTVYRPSPTCMVGNGPADECDDPNVVLPCAVNRTAAAD